MRSLSTFEKQEIVRYHRKQSIKGDYSRSGRYRFIAFAKQFSLNNNNNELVDSDGRIVVSTSEAPDIISKAYNEEYAFFGRDRLYSYLCNKYYGITKQMVASWLARNATHQRHAPRKSHRVVKPVLSNRPNERWQADLIDMQSYASWNKHHRYILAIIDHFSKLAYCVALKNKGSLTMVNAFDQAVLHIGTGYPSILHTDNGSEFKNESMSLWCKKHGVKQVFGSPYKPQSQGGIERFNRTIKSMISRYMSNASTRVWLHVLPTLVDNYNSTKHGTTKMSPKDAHYGDGRRHVTIKNNIMKAGTRHVDTSHVQLYKVGDHVRLQSTPSSALKRGINYSDKVYTIERISDKRGLYKLSERRGIVSHHELLKVEGKVIQPVSKKKVATNDTPQPPPLHRAIRPRSKKRVSKAPSRINL